MPQLNFKKQSYAFNISVIFISMSKGVFEIVALWKFKRNYYYLFFGIVEGTFLDLGFVLSRLNLILI